MTYLPGCIAAGNVAVRVQFTEAPGASPATAHDPSSVSRLVIDGPIPRYKPIRNEPAAVALEFATLAESVTCWPGSALTGAVMDVTVRSTPTGGVVCATVKV